jgi:hypothetical protein
MPMIGSGSVHYGVCGKQCRDEREYLSVGGVHEPVGWVETNLEEGFIRRGESRRLVGLFE